MKRHRRRSIRLPDYDYSSPGAYFVTMCAAHKRLLFGEVVDAQMHINSVGRVVESIWLNTATVRPSAAVDAYVVMPNHLHGVIVLAGENDADSGQPATSTPERRDFSSPSGTLGAIVRGFKGASTAAIRDILAMPQLEVWQRGFYEHVIRGEADLAVVRDYIAGNPARWAEDEENPFGRRHAR